jgi:8-oxo-dGTP pyrophosphatase MutT (NUDIX family)
VDPDPERGRTDANRAAGRLRHERAVSLRPDLVECWVFRVAPPSEPADARPESERLEILLIRRSATRIFPGLWQCVTGGVEPGERVPMAAIREVQEETGFGGGDVEAWYDLDQVAPFFDEGVDGVVVSAIFAARVRPDREVRVSHEHDALRWVPADEAPALAIWPSYAESIRRVRDLLLDPALAPWFAMDGDGRRLARPPKA